VGIQQWFHTPAFLVDMFRQVNPGVEVVSSDPVMDPLRMVKEPAELELMKQAQRIAAMGMNAARTRLRPGMTAQEIATEATYTMMRAGAEATSTPVFVTFGQDTCMLHGRLSEKPLEKGDLVVIDLTPQVRGYCANLARTFVVGKPDRRQAELIAAYREVVSAVRDEMRPGTTIAKLDTKAREVLLRHGFGEYHVGGIGHGIGLRFEEPPASTIIPPHRNLPLVEGMTITIGHTILAIPGYGGVRFEDVYRLGKDGPKPLHEYPVDPVVKPVIEP
jgi:Xaa-Pro aminopeptidase